MTGLEEGTDRDGEAPCEDTARFRAAAMLSIAGFDSPGTRLP